jgi:hypothetical protein
MPVLLEETLDRALQSALYYHRVDVLRGAEQEIERNAINMFRLQAYDLLIAFYDANVTIKEAKKEDDDRELAALLLLLMAALHRRLAQDIRIMTPGLTLALEVALKQSALAKYGITGTLKDIDAEHYLRVHGAELVTGINTYTRERLRVMLADAFRRGASVEDVALKLMTSFDEMTYARGLKIARTEASKAWSYAEMQSAELAERAGYRMVKERLLGPMHPRYDICDHNHEEGAIPLKQLFSSGDMAPPQHPNCGCSLITYPSDGDQPWSSQILGQTPLMPFGSDTGDRNA